MNWWECVRTFMFIVEDLRAVSHAVVAEGEPDGYQPEESRCVDQRLSRRLMNGQSIRLNSNNKIEQVDGDAVYQDAPPHVRDHTPYVDYAQQPLRCTVTRCCPALQR